MLSACMLDCESSDALAGGLSAGAAVSAGVGLVPGGAS